MIFVRTKSLVRGLLGSSMIGYLYGDHMVLSSDFVTIGVSVYPVYFHSVWSRCLVPSCEKVMFGYSLGGHFGHFDLNFLSAGGVNDALLIRRSLLILIARMGNLHVMLLRLMSSLLFLLEITLLSLFVLLISLLKSLMKTPERRRSDTVAVYDNYIASKFDILFLSINRMKTNGPADSISHSFRGILEARDTGLFRLAGENIHGRFSEEGGGEGKDRGHTSSVSGKNARGRTFERMELSGMAYVTLFDISTCDRNDTGFLLKQYSADKSALLRATTKEKEEIIRNCNTPKLYMINGPGARYTREREVEWSKARSPKSPERKYQDRYTKRGVMLYIVDGEARVVPPRCQNKRRRIRQERVGPLLLSSATSVYGFPQGISFFLAANSFVPDAARSTDADVARSVIYQVIDQPRPFQVSAWYKVETGIRSSANESPAVGVVVAAAAAAAAAAKRSDRNTRADKALVCSMIGDYHRDWSDMLLATRHRWPVDAMQLEIKTASIAHWFAVCVTTP
ncbi:hypothetical protein DBV15_02765 [Temnothorax longispinosus]|uniref:Uncharacterized protein n=1 Tax=Temnothorax longispinosus TaxID=300112 RepID=A0A4S2KG63_9HYME|nr:hypothetical protein DBV15_02765 [Temnothorax longispinosus]